jgi:hypothetical protein
MASPVKELAHERARVRLVGPIASEWSGGVNLALRISGGARLYRLRAAWVLAP